MMDKKKNDYKVGYRKPPVHTRFQKGQSGNPCGKPKKVLSEDEILLRELSSKLTVTEDGKRKRLSKFEVMIKQQVKLAMKGDPKAFRHVAETFRNAQRAQAAGDTGKSEERMVFTLVFEEEERRRRELLDEESPDWKVDSIDEI
jgi:hypothetical protein